MAPGPWLFPKDLSSGGPVWSKVDVMHLSFPNQYNKNNFLLQTKAL